jgi:hypothetical protein
MNDLIQTIISKTGMTEAQAMQAIEIISENLKQKFPQILHAEIDNVMNGKKFGDSYREKFEDVKNKAQDASKQFGERAESVMNEVKDKFNELFNSKKPNS